MTGPQPLGEPLWKSLLMFVVVIGLLGLFFSAVGFLADLLLT